MYISHSKKFVILRNRKCASTSLVKLVEPYCEINWKSCEEELGLTYSEIRHYNAEQVMSLFEQKDWEIEDYEIVQTLRNPWDRAVSAFHYERDVVKNIKVQGMTFEEYLDSSIFRNFAKNNNFDKVALIENGTKLLPTIVMKVETINEDIANFSEKVLGERITELDKRNVTNRGAYKDYYNDTNRHLVEKLFESDIKFGNYSF